MAVNFCFRENIGQKYLAIYLISIFFNIAFGQELWLTSKDRAVQYITINKTLNSQNIDCVAFHYTFSFNSTLVKPILEFTYTNENTGKTEVLLNKHKIGQLEKSNETDVEFNVDIPTHVLQENLNTLSFIIGNDENKIPDTVYFKGIRIKYGSGEYIYFTAIDSSNTNYMFIDNVENSNVQGKTMPALSYGVNLLEKNNNEKLIFLYSDEETGHTEVFFNKVKLGKLKPSNEYSEITYEVPNEAINVGENIVGFTLGELPNLIPDEVQFKNIRIQFENTTGVSANSRTLADQQFEVFQNFPNPFNDTTLLSFYIAEAQNVNISIYNMMGQKVTTIMDEKLGEGEHRVSWNAFNFNSGIYFFHIKGENFSNRKKCIYIK